MSKPAAAREGLALHIGVLAGRLAALLDDVLPGSSRTADGREFLRGAFASVSGGQPLAAFTTELANRRTADLQGPLGRLSSVLGLSPLEIDLILLAGMP